MSRPSSPPLRSFARDEFLTRRWLYRPGEHVSVLGPTGAGKTFLSYQLLQWSCSPDLPAVVLAMKPRDSTVDRWTKEIGLRTVRDWPPPPNLWRGRPSGWTLWPKHTFDPDKDDPAHQRIFWRALLDSYKRGRRIVFGDEAYSLSNELKLGRALTTLWTKGRSMDCGLWAATQRPAYVPKWMYSQAQHLFLARDPDIDAQRRYREISGVNPDWIKDALAELPQYHWLYIRQADRKLCVVEP